MWRSSDVHTASRQKQSSKNRCYQLLRTQNTPKSACVRAAALCPLPPQAALSLGLARTLLHRRFGFSSGSVATLEQ